MPYNHPYCGYMTTDLPYCPCTKKEVMRKGHYYIKLIGYDWVPYCEMPKVDSTIYLASFKLPVGVKCNNCKERMK